MHYLIAPTGVFAIFTAMNDGSSHIQYLLKDHQGSLAEVAGSDGQVIESYSFDAFGRRRNAQNWTTQNLPTSFGIDRGYTFHSLSREERNGKHLDNFELINPDTLHCIALSGSATANFSLHCVCENQASAGMNGRMGVYPESPEHSGRFGNPLVARFLSPDPFIQNPEYSQSYNRYSYVFNNPLRFVDPSGYFVEGDSTGGYNWSIPNLFPKTPHRIPEIYETNTDIASEGPGDHNSPVEKRFYIMEWGEFFLYNTPVLGAALRSGDKLSQGDYFGAGVDLMYSGFELATFAYGVRYTSSSSMYQTSNVAAKRGTTVLGRFPEYTNLAGELGARRFNIPTNIWNKMTPTQQWAANQKFLDRMILRGDNIRLATPLNQVKPGSFYQKELNYLFDKGYKISSDGHWLVK